MEHPVSVPLWRRPFRLVGDNKRAYLLLNTAAYGLLVVGFTIGILFPHLKSAEAASLEADGTGDLVRYLIDTPPLFALTILAVNVFRLSLLTIALPSFVVPFAGLPIFGYWAVDTGITLAPTSPQDWVLLIPHSVTVLIEYQAYVLVLLGVWLLGRCWLFPRAAGAPDRRRGYLCGLRSMGLLAPPALAFLAIGAMGEAYSLRYFVHPLMQ